MSKVADLAVAQFRNEMIPKWPLLDKKIKEAETELMDMKAMSPNELSDTGVHSRKSTCDLAEQVFKETVIAAYRSDVHRRGFQDPQASFEQVESYVSWKERGTCIPQGALIVQRMSS